MERLDSTSDRCLTGRSRCDISGSGLNCKGAIFLLLIFLFPFKFVEYKALNRALDIGLGVQSSDDRCVRFDIKFEVVTDCVAPVVLCLGPDLRLGGNAKIIHLLILSGSAGIVTEMVPCLIRWILSDVLKNQVPTYTGRYLVLCRPGIGLL